MQGTEARRQAITLCLTLMEAQVRLWSRSQSMLEPLEGFEAPWRQGREALALLRGLLLEARTEAEHAQREAAR